MLLLGQRSLTASDADYRLFAGRFSGLRRVCRALDLGLNAYVHGPPGSGRTSFLRQVERRQPEARYVRLHELETLEDRLEQIEQAVTDSEAIDWQAIDWDQLRSAITLMRQARPTAKIKTSVDPLSDLRKAVRRQDGEPRRVVLVDDLSRQDCQQLFGRLRDELWELPIQWVVTGSDSQLDRPADTFFDTVVELLPFDREGLRELVRRRAASGTAEEESLLMSIADTVVDTAAPCTPRHALSVLRDLFLSEDLTETASQLAELHAARADLKPTARRLLDALIHHGPAHAGDEQLLSEIGVTRSRVVQLLAELEADGLVTSQQAGRRKLFAVNPGRHAVPAVAAAREDRTGAAGEP